MERRRVLAAVGAGALAAVAGCAEGENYAEETPTASKTTTPFPNPEGLAVAERDPTFGDPLGVEAVVANGADGERTGTLVAVARLDPDDGPATADERRREVTVPGRSSESFTVELDLDLPAGAVTGTSVVDAYIAGNR